MTKLELHNKKLKEEARIRKIEYNKNPHMCKYCQNPILMGENDKYNDIYRKNFCSRSCSSKFGHKETDRYRNNINIRSRIEEDFSDAELIDFFNEASSINDLESKIGYTNITSQPRVINRFLNLGLDIKLLRKTPVVEIFNFTKAELFNRYKQWQTARSTIQKYARSIYQNSNKPKQCIICGYDKHYEVAHIKAVSDFDDDSLISEINDENNLIALCPNHHWEYDNANLDISEYIK